MQWEPLDVVHKAATRVPRQGPRYVDSGEDSSGRRDQRGPELMDVVPDQAVSGAARRWSRPPLCRRRSCSTSFSGLFGALDDGGRSDRHDGEDLRALRVELGELTGQDIEGGGPSTAPPLQRDGSAASASVHAATTAASASASTLPGSVPPNEVWSHKSCALIT
ncbi:hypothetical protein AB0G71_22390 [Streptomyces sp. NPDC020403]|uniref:hypothetical protein n=1 Tax=unclassified Streptomyces TaxID=2593676 RepID=UPI0033D401D7